MLNQSNSAVAKYHYAPFGKTMWAQVSQNAKYRFTGQEFDEQTGLYNFRARMYDADLNIFYSVDPADKEFSSYAYCANNPVNRMDLDGRDWYMTPKGDYVFDPNIKSQHDLNKAGLGSCGWIGPEFKLTLPDKSTMEFRNDGSVYYSNAQWAFKALTENYTYTWEKKNTKGTDVKYEVTYDSEKMVVFLSDEGGAIMLPWYKNNSHGSYPEEYGYSLKNRVLTINNEFRKESVKFKFWGHCHPDYDGASGTPNPKYKSDLGDRNLAFDINTPAFVVVKGGKMNYFSLDKTSINYDVKNIQNIYETTRNVILLPGFGQEIKWK